MQITVGLALVRGVLRVVLAAMQSGLREGWFSRRLAPNSKFSPTSQTKPLLGQLWGYGVNASIPHEVTVSGGQAPV